jgi:hypothetical protein
MPCDDTSECPALTVCHSHQCVDCASVTAKLPDVPRLLAPVRGAYTGSLLAPSARRTLRPTFVWSGVADTCGATTYELQADDSCAPGALESCAFDSPELSETGLAQTSFEPSKSLKVAKTAPVGAFYGWRVRACDASRRCSDYSDVGNLHVGRVREDLNGDGFGDVVLLNAGTDLLVYLGARAFDPSAPSTDLAIPSSDQIGAFAGDLNGDGFGDLALMQTYAPTSGYVPVVVFGGTDLSALATETLTKSAAGSSLNLALHAGGDLNGDGYDDLLVDFKYFDPTTELQVFFGDSSLGTGASLHIPSPFPIQYTLASAGVGDVNGDGYADFALTAQGEDAASTWTGALRVYAGGKTPSTTAVADIELVGGQTAEPFAGGDVDGDGYGEIVVRESSVGLRLYHGGKSFAQSSWKTLPDAATSAGLAGFDVNLDGYADSLLLGTVASFYLGDAEGPSAATPFPSARGLDQFLPSTFSDHDGDGAPDLLGSIAGSGGARAPFWCGSTGTAAPTCLNISSTSPALGSFGFAR